MTGRDRRRSRHTDDTDVLRRIHHVIGELPIWLSSGMGAASQTNRTYWYACDQCQTCLPDHAPECAVARAKAAVPPSKRAHTRQSGCERNNQRWCSDGLSSAVITEKNCGSRSRWTAVTVRHCTGAVTTGRKRRQSESRYQDVMLGQWDAALASFRRLQWSG